MRFPTSFISLLSLYLSLSARTVFVEGTGSLEPSGLQPLVARANVYLAAGQFSDAVKAFGEAIELSPIDYLLYYKRATAHLSLSRHAQALDDFEQVIRLSKGNFDKAYLMKGTIYAREGQWKDAKAMVLAYKSKSDKAAQDLLFSVSQGEKNHKEALLAQKAKDWNSCTEQATSALEVATHSIPIRTLRVDCAFEKGDIEQVVADLSRLTHLTSPSSAHFLRLAALSYHILPPQNPPQAISILKQCLHRDPDSKPCATAHRSYKSLEKSFARLQALRDAQPPDPRVLANFIEGKTGFLNTYLETLVAQMKAIEPPLPSSINPVKKSDRLAGLLRSLCKSYIDMKLPRKGEQYCEELLRMDGHGQDVDGLVGRGEACLVKEEWEDGVRAFEKAFEASGRSNADVQQRLQRAQRQLKQARKKDYYKVLGVTRDADERTIKKAYKKAAKSAHPDKGGTEDKMAAVNEAYEVLSKPELRQRFDNGDDPNDPTSGFGGGGGGGAQFFQGQGGGNPFVFFQNGGPFSGARFKFSG